MSSPLDGPPPPRPVLAHSQPDMGPSIAALIRWIEYLTAQVVYFNHMFEVTGQQTYLTQRDEHLRECFNFLRALNATVDYVLPIATILTITYAREQLNQQNLLLTFEPSMDPVLFMERTRDFFEDQVDANLFKRLYGESHCEVIDVDLVFNLTKSGRLARWYLKQVIANLCRRTLLLVESELELNKTTGLDGSQLYWESLLPSDTPFVFDDGRRQDLADFFKLIPTNYAFKEVELYQFPWRQYSNDKKRKAAESVEGPPFGRPDQPQLGFESQVHSSDDDGDDDEYESDDDEYSDKSRESSRSPTTMHLEAMALSRASYH
ncbi:hypothetical protein F4804DRAFT_337532 [Jackrogersella minutella]|nr:hypothetical protein F4804DRAFT_337532 [Jackrogersella minutella]